MIVTGMLISAAGFATMGIAHGFPRSVVSRFFRSRRYAFWTAFSAGGQIQFVRSNVGPLLSVDDAADKARRDWRVAVLAFATIRFSPGLRDRRYFVHIMRPFQRMAASGLEAINGQ